MVGIKVVAQILLINTDIIDIPVELAPMPASKLMPVPLDASLFIPATALRVDWSFLQRMGGIQFFGGL